MHMYAIGGQNYHFLVGTKIWIHLAAALTFIGEQQREVRDEI